jgi:integral membrane protein
VLKDALRSLQLIGYAEGTSFLVLLGIAMPLKHFAGIPEAVLVVGWAHGILWVLYVLAALRAKFVCEWSIGTLFWAGVASVMPFGPFVFDGWLRMKRDRGGVGTAET